VSQALLAAPVGFDRLDVMHPTPIPIGAEPAATHDLRIVRFDNTMIIADLDQRLSGWPDKADSMEFRLNRLTGDAEINYLQKPKDTDPVPG
jgi:hypothetical protein